MEAVGEPLGSFDGRQSAVSKPNEIKADARAGKQNAAVWWLEWLVEAAGERFGSFDRCQTAVSKPNKIKADARAGKQNAVAWWLEWLVEVAGERLGSFDGWQTAASKRIKSKLMPGMAQRERWPGSHSSAKGNVTRRDLPKLRHTP